MESWFTVEEIDRETFAVSEYKHWEETHCYLLCGKNVGLFRISNAEKAAPATARRSGKPYEGLPYAP